jgi:nitrite reductase/ring-hydroxylating ferredoxin subunit
MQSHSASLPPYPNGWYVLGFSNELQPGGIVTRKFMGQEIVLFRTMSGEPAAIDAYCPHLGAHFGRGGTIEREAIRCPFHHFEFDRQGQCVATGYGSKPPPTAQVKAWPLRERNGTLLVYYDGEEREPEWEVPPLDTKGWTPLIYRQWPLHSHPQETTENSVDIGHFTIVHGYDGVKTLKQAETDGPYLNASYAITRKVIGSLNVQAHFDVHVHGLGFSLVEVAVQGLGIRTRQFVFPTPIDEERIVLRIALSMKKAARARELPPYLRPVPPRLFNWLVPRVILSGYAHDVRQDFEVWENKIYVSPPALAKGDGPIGKYRTWARQFYM